MYIYIYIYKIVQIQSFLAYIRSNRGTILGALMFKVLCCRGAGFSTKKVTVLVAIRLLV